MKKTVSMGLGGRNFIIDEDAFIRLKSYLDAYGASLKENRQEVMDEVEMRVADLLKEGLSDGKEVVDINQIENIAKQMGLPNPDAAKGQYAPGADSSHSAADGSVKHKFYRDTDDRKIGGVCSGFAAYFDVDVTVLRIIALIMLLCCGAGFWFYIICCIVAPSAYTAAEKCELRGLPCTVENLQRFTNTSK